MAAADGDDSAAPPPADGKTRSAARKQRRKRKLQELRQQGAGGDAALSALVQRRRERNRRRADNRKSAKRGKAAAAASDKAAPAEPATASDNPDVTRAKKQQRKEKPPPTDQQPDNVDQSTSKGDAAAEKLKSGRFRFINEKLYTSTGQQAVELFKQDEEAFRIYHEGYRNQLKKWSCDPLRGVISKLKTRDAAGLVVCDMGCGTARLAASLAKATVHSFDLVADNERVTVADIAHVPLESGSVDVCVYCLSLMGTNVSDFLREAGRILKMSGKLIIVEIVSRIASIRGFVMALHKLGFDLEIKKRMGGDMFVMFELTKARKPFNKRPPGLKLFPCLYKKR